MPALTIYLAPEVVERLYALAARQRRRPRDEAGLLLERFLLAEEPPPERPADRPAAEAAG